MAKQKILVVDDEQDIVETLEFRLKSKGFEVDTAYDGEEALEQVKSGEPDLIILDLMMPKMDGREFCRRLKTDSENQIIPIIMLTAKAEDKDKIEGLEHGADDYIIKPFKFRDLMRSVKGLLKLREQDY